MNHDKSNGRKANYRKNFVYLIPNITSAAFYVLKCNIMKNIFMIYIRYFIIFYVSF